MKTLCLNDLSLWNNQADVFVADNPLLSASALDLLTEQCRDWVGSLPADQKVELSHCRFPEIEKALSKHGNELTVADIVYATLHLPYQKINVFQQSFWSYTCCLHVFGLGRIRFVVCFDNPDKAGTFKAFMTNRLDWSATRVAMNVLPYHPTSPFHPQLAQRNHSTPSYSPVLAMA